MSLVNDMLVQLEQRRGQNDHALAGIQSAPPTATPQRKAPRGVVIVALMSMTTGAALLGYHGWDQALQERVELVAEVEEDVVLHQPVVEIGRPVPNEVPASQPMLTAFATAVAPASEPPPVLTGLRRYRLDYDLARKPQLRPHRPPVKSKVETAAAVPKLQVPAADESLADTRVEIRRQHDNRQAGLRALRAGRPGEAAEAFRRLTAEQPLDAEAYLLLSQALRAQSRGEAARAILQQALVATSQPARIARALAEDLLEAGAPEEAQQVLEQYRDTAGADLDYHAMLAAVYERNGDYAGARDRYGFLVTQQPQRGAWWVGLAIASESQGALTDARLAYETARASTDLDATLAAYAAQRLSHLGDAK